MRSPTVSGRAVVAAAVVAPWAAWALVRGLGFEVGHPLVEVLALTPYAAAASVVAILVAIALRAWVVAVIAVAACATLVAVVAPRAIEGPQLAADGAAGRPLVVMTVNLYGGRGDAADVMRLVREQRVDVVSVQELTPAAVRALDAAGARVLLPGRLLMPGKKAGGSGLFARRALRPVPPRIREQHHAQPEARLRVPGADDVQVKVVHPLPPISATDVTIWRRQLVELGEPEQDGLRRVLAGDFNATLDHRELRDLLGRGFYDAADAAGAGLRPTWPVGRARPRLTIDHIVVPAGIQVVRVTVDEISGSDHRAVIAALLVPAR